MKFCVALVACILACASAAPNGTVLPRLPVSVLLSGRYQTIPEDKIVGGSPVQPNSLPFQISLQHRYGNTYSHMCGGSILGASTILCAAHCAVVFPVSDLRVVAGEHRLSQDSGFEQYRNVTSKLVHEKYNATTMENDIAIFKLATPLDLSVPSVKPVKLPSSLSDPAPGTKVTVSGWGATSSGGSSSSDVLLSVNLPVVSDAQCRALYADETIVPSMLCAGDTTNGGIDSCQGDSGGPLFIGSGANAVQHGIVSWGYGCASAKYPGVYTQVSYFLDWIAANNEDGNGGGNEGGGNEGGNNNAGKTLPMFFFMPMLLLVSSMLC